MKETKLPLEMLIEKTKEMLATKRAIENGSSYEEELAKIKSKEQN
jgi:hypothetical protein